MGAFAPQPPHYFEPAAEVIARLTAAPGAAGTLPRIAANLFAYRFLASLAAEDHTAGGADSARLLRVIATFLEHQARVPAQLLAALTNGKQASAGSAPEPQTGGAVLFPEA